MLPPDTVKVVYLDLNHWISLSQAAAGHPKGSVFTKVLDACRAERSAGTALFVLSSTHYMELLKIKDPAQREKLAEVTFTFGPLSIPYEHAVAFSLDREGINALLIPKLIKWSQNYKPKKLVEWTPPKAVQAYLMEHLVQLWKRMSILSKAA
jgi:hypothetical protein